MLTVAIRTDGAAFEDYASDELARMLRGIAGRLQDGHNGGAVVDVNGNNVGTWEFVPDELEGE